MWYNRVSDLTDFVSDKTQRQMRKDFIIMTFWEIISRVYNGGIFSFLSGGDDLTAVILTGVGVFVSLVAGYLLGSFNPAIHFSKKLYGEDIRKSGSGNAGSTNMLRTHGKKAGLITALCDLGKTVIACLIGYLCIGYNGAALAGFGALLGHIAPVFYKFKGGKGVMVAAATVLMLDPITFLICIAIFAGVFYISRTVSIASIMAVLVYPMILNRVGNYVGISLICAILTTVVVFFMHRENISRILAGTEPKTTIGGNKNKKNANEDENGDSEN